MHERRGGTGLPPDSWVASRGAQKLDRALGIRLPAWVAPLGLALILLTVLYASKEDEPAPQQEDEAREELAGEEK